MKPMKKVALTELKDDLSRYLRLAEKEQILITRHGRPAGVLTGFASEDEWFDYQLENDPRFLKRIEKGAQACKMAKVSNSKMSPLERNGEQADEAERKWRSGFKLKSTSPAPFPPAYPKRYRTNRALLPSE